jgi:hypothetical protein
MEIVFDLQAFEDYSKKLKSLHKSAYPTVVRNTLTSGAMTTKTKTLDREAKQTFERREKNFFKANSKFIPAKGWNIDKMQSIVGMYENKLSNKSTNYAVKDLEKQEQGGKIGGRSLIPMKQARIGGKGKTKAKERIQNIKKKKLIMVNESDGRTRKQQFVRASIMSVTKGDGLVLGHKTSSGNRILYRVDFLRTGVKNRNFQLKYTKLYNFRKNRKVDVDKTNFMQKSAERGSKAMPHTFRKEAERQFKKHLG